MKRAFPIFGRVAVCCYLWVVLISSHAFAQSQLNWKDAKRFSEGIESTVAIAPSGLIVEFHKSPKNNGMFYHVGKAFAQSGGGYVVEWGPNQPMQYDCHRPSVAISKEGWLLFVCTKNGYTGYGSGVTMRYWVGQLNPAGDGHQVINWRLMDAFYDNGQFGSVSFNTNDFIADVHESANNNKLFYRVGRFRNPNAGQFDIVWGTGSGGKEYDKGVYPSIAINDLNEVIEVHQTQKNETLLHYRRGILQGDRIDWLSKDSFRYENDSSNPAVALTNQGTIIEVARKNKNDTIFARTGVQLPSSATLEWSNGVEISWDGYGPTLEPSVATNGAVVISTWEIDKKLYFSTAPVR